MALVCSLLALMMMETFRFREMVIGQWVYSIFPLIHLIDFPKNIYHF